MRMERRSEPELMDLPEEAKVYAEADFADVNRAFVQRLLELAGHAQHLRVVDVGTGPAEIPILIAKARPTWHITGVDGSKAMLLIAQSAVEAAQLQNRLRLHLADAKSTGLTYASFEIGRAH